MSIFRGHGIFGGHGIYGGHDPDLREYKTAPFIEAQLLNPASDIWKPGNIFFCASSHSTSTPAWASGWSALPAQRCYQRNGRGPSKSWYPSGHPSGSISNELGALEADPQGLPQSIADGSRMSTPSFVSSFEPGPGRQSRRGRPPMMLSISFRKSFVPRQWRRAVSTSVVPDRLRTSNPRRADPGRALGCY